MDKTSFDIKKVTGLSVEEAAEKLQSEGYNELPLSRKRDILHLALGLLKEPMFLLLFLSGGIYLLLGDLEEALMLLGFVFVVTGITVVQENKTERTLEALRNLSSPRAQVIRDGREQRIAGREVVKGDILILAEGDRIPADARLLSCEHLLIDESLLTGESVPVQKSLQHTPLVYSGTLIVQGHAVAQVTATGVVSEMGRIGKSLESIRDEETRLQKETKHLVRILALAGLSLSTLVTLIYGFSLGNWLKGVLAGVALSMAMMPEEFLVVLSVFLALGAWRISQKRVLTRKVAAIETLGSATVLCVDKTGTLTQNQMSVTELFTQNQALRLNKNEEDFIPDNFHELVEFALLASQAKPFDPMEKAIIALRSPHLLPPELLHDQWRLIREYPLSEELLALSHVWKHPREELYTIAAKGAPEAIISLCHLQKNDKAKLLREINQMADWGLRVLGVAKATQTVGKMPSDQHAFKFKFLGLVGLADPVRPAVADSIQECCNAGVRVVMITGDYPGTAQNIARQIGLKDSDKYLEGSKIDEMTDPELQQTVKSVNVFARVVPEQKLRLVNALKANGEIVAMTGDGVNDAPALKSAHIGIAMGGRGTDVAREAASLVLMDDDFSSIVETIKMGRRIYDNLKKALSYTVSVHTPIAGIALIPILLKWPLVLLPVHIAFLELIIDPACSLVFEAEAEEVNVMNRPPRDIKKPLFGGSSFFFSVLHGLVVLAAVLGVTAFSHYQGQTEAQTRTLAFTTLVISNLGLILVNLSRYHHLLKFLTSKNRAMWSILIGTISFLGLILYLPYLRNLFQFSSVSLSHMFLPLGAVIASVLIIEVIKSTKKPPGLENV